MSESGDSVLDPRANGPASAPDGAKTGANAPPTTGSTGSGLTTTKRPWYFSTTVIALAFFVFSPLGSFLILTDRRRGRKAKLRAAIVLLFSLTLLTYRIFFMPPTHF